MELQVRGGLMCISEFGEKWFNTGKMLLEATNRHEYPLQRSLATCYISIKHGLLIAGTSVLGTFYCSSCSGRSSSAIRAKVYIVHHICCYSMSPLTPHASNACYLCRTLSLLTAWKTATRLRQTRWHMCTPHSSNYGCTMCSHQLHFVTFAEIDLNRTRCSVFQHLRHVLSSCAFCEAALFDYLQPVSLSDSHLWLPFDEVFFFALRTAVDWILVYI